MIGVMLKLERSKIAIDVYGEMVECTRPSLDEAIALEAEINEAKGDSAKMLSVMKAFLSRCGFPEKLTGSMETGHLFLVIEALSGKKKD